MQTVAYDYAFMFKYSERSGTFAAKQLKDDVAEEVKTRRLEEIIAVQRNSSHKSNLADIGKTFEVLIEGHSERSADFILLKQPKQSDCFPKTKHTIGDYVNVKVESCTAATLFGKAVEEKTI